VRRRPWGCCTRWSRCLSRIGCGRPRSPSASSGRSWPATTSGVRRVLDVACGPGTNARHSRDVEYLGVDWNEAYVRYAARRYGERLPCVDVISPGFAFDQTFDFILVNSVLPHSPDTEVESLLDKLARLDRGEYARRLAARQRLLSKPFAPDVFEPYTLTGLGVPLWHQAALTAARDHATGDAVPSS